MVGCVDIFCGVGGLTHGLSLGGIQVLAGIDLDPECRFPYEANNSAKFFQQDVSAVTGEDLKRIWAGHQYSLLAGCAPCQPFSTYGRRKDKSPASKRKWDLVTDFARLIVESRPDFVTMENVPQLVRHDVFPELLDALVDYHVSFEVVDCPRFAVPQTRKRLVLLASRLGAINLKVPHFPSMRSVGPPTVRTAIADLPALEAGEFDPSDPLHAACRLSPLNLRRIKASRPGGTWREWSADLVADCHARSSGDTYPSVYGRMNWDSPAPTITTQCFGYGNGRFGHPEQDRAITLREAAVLQTFPRSYKFLQANERVRYSVLGRLIGNAVPVKIGEHIALSIAEHVEQNRTGGSRMKPQPAPKVPGSTDAERMSNALGIVLKVSKEELLRREAALTGKKVAARDGKPKK